MKRFILGLTGSIGMGKSTTAAMFAAKGVPIWDADAAVHRLYATDGAATRLIAMHYPDAIENGAVSRSGLRAKIAADPSILEHIQKLVHPLVAEDRAQFLANNVSGLVVVDVPLLFETGTDALCDGVAVVSTDSDTQKARVLARGQMTHHEFEVMLARQLPDAEKRKRATWIIPTDSLEHAEQAVVAIIAEIDQRLKYA